MCGSRIFLNPVTYYYDELDYDDNEEACYVYDDNEEACYVYDDESC